MKFLISEKHKSASGMHPKPHQDAKISYVEDKISNGFWQLWTIEIQMSRILQNIVKSRSRIEIRWNEACELPEIILGGKDE